MRIVIYLKIIPFFKRPPISINNIFIISSFGSEQIWSEIGSQKEISRSNRLKPKGINLVLKRTNSNRDRTWRDGNISNGDGWKGDCSTQNAYSKVVLKLIH